MSGDQDMCKNLPNFGLPVLGWLCPLCKRGLAPHVTVCPCEEASVDPIATSYGFYDKLIASLLKADDAV